MLHREERRGRFFVSGKGTAGLLEAFPGLGVARICADMGMLGVNRRRQGVGGKAMVDRYLSGRQGRAPNLNLVE